MAQAAKTQSFINYNPDYYHLIDRYQIINGKTDEQIFTISKPFSRYAVAKLAEKLDSLPVRKSRADLYNIQFLKNDNWEWLSTGKDSGSYSRKKLFKYFFERKSDAFSEHNDEYDIHISPLFYFQYGKGPDSSFWQNTRGIEIRGSVGKRLGFYTQLTENQIVLPQYQRDFYLENNVVPGEAHTKPFGKRGVDYTGVRGYISFNILKPINITFGHDKHFIGDGYRSMILSDFSAPMLFLKINTQIKKIQYVNLFTQLSNYQNYKNNFNQVIPKKYMVMHQLNWKATKRTEIGLSEIILLGRDHDIDFNYLNPVIFYRSIEFNLGSPDNAMAAFQFKHITRKKISVYGQFLFDELIKGRLFSNSENFANKWSYQVGTKAINLLGIKNLDYQFEFNKIRPYTYSHFNTTTNYTNFNQALAHPMGANLKEWLHVLRYQPWPKLTWVNTFINTHIGKDYNSLNWGSNILLDYDIRVRDDGNKIGQGLTTTQHFFESRLSYQMAHNLLLDVAYLYRSSKNINKYQQAGYPSLTFRWNVPYKTVAL